MILKQNYEQDEKYRRWIASLPCAVTGLEESTQCAHIRRGAQAGMSRKPGDIGRCVPLSVEEHRIQGEIGEVKYWYKMGGWEKALVLAKKLGEVAFDTDKALVLLDKFRRGESL